MREIWTYNNVKFIPCLKYLPVSIVTKWKMGKFKVNHYIVVWKQIINHIGYSWDSAHGWINWDFTHATNQDSEKSHLYPKLFMFYLHDIMQFAIFTTQLCRLSYGKTASPVQKIYDLYKQWPHSDFSNLLRNVLRWRNWQANRERW